MGCDASIFGQALQPAHGRYKCRQPWCARPLVLLQAQGVTKVKTTNQFDEQFAKLEVQMSKLAEKAKAAKTKEPKKKKWMLSESEFEVYKEWSKLHQTTCQKCGATYEGNTEGRPAGRIWSRQQLAGGMSWGCSGGAQRSYGDHIHPIQLRFHGKPLF